MTAHRLLFLYLWIAPHVLQVALAVMMVRRKLAREFPAFFLYTVFEVLQFAVLFALCWLVLAGRWSAEPYIDAVAAQFAAGLHLCK